ncbi:hypothetical protein EBI_25893 [Enterocytozoon bieneusi H348]|nr:hypothetical protein EBI_25893 [Enterocytozoon bieneusi H348]|eukprot:XP_002650585.1 hypothetical protein EBI_25893 [Enterocytozoon bieneusi H348]
MQKKLTYQYVHIINTKKIKEIKMKKLACNNKIKINLKTIPKVNTTFNDNHFILKTSLDSTINNIKYNVKIVTELILNQQRDTNIILNNTTIPQIFIRNTIQNIDQKNYEVLSKLIKNNCIKLYNMLETFNKEIYCDIMKIIQNNLNVISPNNQNQIKHNNIKMNLVSLEKKVKNAFEIRNSLIHGKGVFSKIMIPKNVFLFSYEGEIIGKIMSDKREKNYIKNGINSIYMFALGKDKIIDATLVGNQARYVNHSCKPNCLSHECLDTNTIKYYSIRTIYPDEEITIDYCNVNIINPKNCNCLWCQKKKNN